MSGKKLSGQVRIISGKWRGRLVSFSATQELRPTSGRLKETLFNWLGNEVEGKDCLDLFAGSGALGFECLSRGAHFVTLVDKCRKSVQGLKQSARLLGIAQQAQIIKADALALLRSGAFNQCYHLIFVDPPFAANTIPELGLYLPKLMYPDGLVYVESPRLLTKLELGEHFKIIKQTQVGDVYGHLFQLANLTVNPKEHLGYA